MEQYANRGGGSGVTAFEIDGDSITVEFRDGSRYLYDHSNPGRAEVEHMKRLAKAGQGLNSYISSFIKKNFAEKLR